MADQGWVKLYRNLLDDVVWKLSTSDQRSVLITILLLANHSASEWEWNGEEFTVNPGQFVTSLDSLAKKSGRGISVQNVRSSLKRFEKLNFLTNKSTKHGRLITVANWAKYQCQDYTPTKKATNAQQRPNKDPTPNKNDKNVKKNTPASSTLEEDFEKLWNLYPKKVGKKPALAAYKRAMTRKKNPATNKQIQTGIVAYRRLKAEDGTEKEFIKNGDTFFKQEAWNDFAEMVQEEQQERQASKPQFDPRQTAIDMYIDYNSLDRVLEEIQAQDIPINPEDAKQYIEEYDERRQQA